ncbi:nuclear transport factor 2 family protein [Kutzneria sp. CA-103260]|uniref:nuclear transport factor 2 family protein n=1 Tax=Kutzneria sp. CA-103260 TaxID=2802641 RepID=UPI001BA8CD97|nr:nuclear transport factor 2 family protein [Kutzneria sp. CA-103260]QUQ63695.1 hypothetical protein JJ691_14080 [Kutzneria sp. CA-103260]
MTTSIEAQLRHLSDRFEIQDIVVRYGLGQDLHQSGDNNVLAEWDQVFTPESTVDYSAAGTPSGIGYKELADIMRRPGGSMSHLRNWQHFEGLPTVLIDGDTATARTPHIHTHKGNGDWNLIETGFFVDRLERRPEGWRIVHRKLEILWMDTFPTAASGTGPA